MSRLTILVSTLALLVVLGVLSLFWQSRIVSAQPPAVATPNHAFISEYIEGSGNNKAVEIFNGTGATIDLLQAKYVVQIIKPDAAAETIALTGTIANDTTWVVVHSQAQEPLKQKKDQLSPKLSFSGDDVVILSKDGMIVDVIGQIGLDPGDAWGANLLSTEDSGLRRRCAILGDNNGGDPFHPGLEWDGYDSRNLENLGSHTLTCDTQNIPPHVIRRMFASDSVDAPLNADLVLAFSEAVTVDENWFLIWCDSSGDHGAEVSGGPEQFTLVVDEDFLPGERCRVNLFPPLITDQDGAPDALHDIAAWEFFAVPPRVSLWQIQGASHSSPYLGQRVVTTESIVTRLAQQGFWMQSLDDDADDATSNGIFVATGGAPKVEIAQSVVVTGVVVEEKGDEPGSYALSVTQLQNVIVQIVEEDGELPAPAILDGQGRAIPKATIDDDHFTSYDPDQDAIDFFESLEGMLVQVDDAIVVGPSDVFGKGTSGSNETWVIANGRQHPGPFTPRSGIYITEGDYNPERIQLHIGKPYRNGWLGWESLSVGTRLTTTGVVDYSFNSYEVVIEGAPEIDKSGVPTREVTTLLGDADHLTIATFNVENLGGDLLESEFVARADQIVNHLGSPDIIVVEEIQDNNGEMNDTTVDASFTFTRLISTIRSLGGPAYRFQQINPADVIEGGADGGNIRVGFLYGSKVDFVAPPSGHPGDDNGAGEVICTNGEPSLSANPMRFAIGNPAYIATRKPLVGQFSVNSQTLFVIGLHLSSKGGDGPIFGTVQPPILETEPRRIEQATVVNEFVGEILACNPDANVIVLGDMNDYPFSPALAALKGEELVNLIELLPENERYSYVYQGNSQVLDQILVSTNITNTMQPEYDIVHVNAEFAMQVSDHDPSVARFALPSP